MQPSQSQSVRALKAYVLICGCGYPPTMRSQVLKLAETQKWKAELLESIETVVMFVHSYRQQLLAMFAVVAWRHSVMLAICCTKSMASSFR